MKQIAVSDTNLDLVKKYVKIKQESFPAYNPSVTELINAAAAYYFTEEIEHALKPKKSK